MEDKDVAEMLMAAGMTSVLVIPLLVLYLRRGPILAAHTVSPEEAPKKKVAPAASSTDAGTLDAIKAAVDILTAGKGQVVKIEKL